MKKSLLYILFLLFITISVHASSITITTPRDTYSIKETVQVEIITDIKPLNQISIQNLKLTNESTEIPVQYFIEKLSDQHYFVYFNIPDVEKDKYKFQIKNIQYVEDGFLKQKTEIKEIYINKINSGFYFLLSKQNTDGGFNTISETAIASLALKNVYPENAQRALNYLMNNQDEEGCYPKNNCNIKDTAFALLALKEFNKETLKTRNYLLDAQNNFNIGKWTLSLYSGNSQCAVNNKDYHVTGKQTIDIESPDMAISCQQSTKVILRHSFLGNERITYNAEIKNISIMIDNTGCFGKEYRSSCDYEATGISTYVLQKIGQEVRTDWFEKNPSDKKTIDQALLYLIKNNPYAKDWLLANVITDSNAWPYETSSGQKNIDVYSSIFATLSLKDTEQYKKSLDFLERQTTKDPLTSSLILYFFLNAERKNPVISIFPGVVYKKDSFKLIMKSRDDLPVAVDVVAPNFTDMPQRFTLTDINIFEIAIPKHQGDFNIEIRYSNHSYVIPVITSNTVNMTNMTEQSNKSNKTQYNIITPLLQPPKNSIAILSKRKYIDDIFLKKDQAIKEFNLTNTWDYQLNNITFMLTGNLNEVIELEKDRFTSISKDEIKHQRLIINKNKNITGIYDGELIIMSDEFTETKLPIKMTFTEDQDLYDRQKTAGSEKNNIVEQDTNKENFTGSSSPGITKSKKTYLIWLIPFIILLAIALAVFFLAKGPKNNNLDKFIEGLNRE
ncbi:terpene cyclase/mutase family protein [Candidatus Woesearchaeota archaeon]|nr:terpene cyclase/mutase family protein [Candidatus Woesearchaeota archaeon]